MDSSEVRIHTLKLVKSGGPSGQNDSSDRELHGDDYSRVFIGLHNYFFLPAPGPLYRLLDPSGYRPNPTSMRIQRIK